MIITLSILQRGDTGRGWDIVQTAFGEGRLIEEAKCQVMFLIPKGVGNYYGIILVEAVWKLVTVVLNIRLTVFIAFHNILHGFMAVRGTGTASFEYKQLHQLAAMREEVLYVIFLNPHKAYVALDRDRCLDILEGYGMVPRYRHIHQEY